MHRRFSRTEARRRQSQAPDTFSLASRNKKKKTWKVVVEPEFNDEDDEDELMKETEYEKKPFDCDQIYNLISETVKRTFVTGLDDDNEVKPYVYNPSENVHLCQQISKDIRNELKTWKHLVRYRIIVLTTIVEKCDQGIHYRMKSLTDPKTDNFVKYYMDNPNFYVIVLVMLIYQDQ